MLIAGLTGGIASGKSTVAEIFQNAGAIIIDADLIARKVVAPESPAWRAIRSIFGDRVIGPDGAVDRPVLGELVFNDRGLRKQLEGIIHPLVRDHMDREVARIVVESSDALVIKDIPLLFETGMTGGLAEIIVVYVPADIQLKRLKQRDGIGPDAARARINAQMSIEEKRRLGTIVIDNSGDFSNTETQALVVCEKLTERARQTG